MANSSEATNEGLGCGGIAVFIAVAFVHLLIVHFLLDIYENPLSAAIIATVALIILYQLSKTITARKDLQQHRRLTNVPARNYQDLPKLEAPAGYVYIIQDVDFSNRYKIGRTNHPRTRLNKFGVELPFKTEVVHILRTDDAVATERDLHKKFSKSHARGEWFDLDDAQLRAIRQLGQQPKQQRELATNSNHLSNPVAKLASICLIFLIILVVFSMIEDESVSGGSILFLSRKTPTALPTYTPTSVPPTVLPTDTPTSIPPTAPPTDTPTLQPAPTVTATVASSPKYMVETSGGVNANIRACPRTSCDIVAKFAPGSEVEVIGRVVGETVYGTDIWLEVSFKGGSAYIHSELAEVPPLRQPNSLGVNLERFSSTSRNYTHGQVNVRAGPGTHYPLLDSVPAGTALEVVGKSGDWYLIRRGEREVYIAGWLTFDTPLSEPGSGSQNTLENAPVGQGAVAVQVIDDVPSEVNQPPPVDNCCFIGWQCNTEEEWQKGYIAFQNNQCESSSQPARSSSSQPEQRNNQRFGGCQASYVRNCSHARSLGCSNIPRGHPAYRPALDRDKDGYGCDA